MKLSAGPGLVKVLPLFFEFESAVNGGRARVVLVRVASVRVAPARFAPVRFALVRTALVRFALGCRLVPE